MRSLRTHMRASIAVVVQDEDDDRGREAIDAEVVPAAALEPGAEPLEREESGEEREERAEQAGESRVCESAGVGVVKAESFAPDGQRREDHGQGKAEGFDAHFFNALQNADGDGGAGAGE